MGRNAIARLCTYGQWVELAVCRRYTFEAAHQLEWHRGKCRQLHGHSYVLEVEVVGLLDANGVVVDFEDVDRLVEPVVQRLDHTFLNDVIGNPTAECVVTWIADQLSELGWTTMRLWETERGSVVVRRQ